MSIVLKVAGMTCAHCVRAVDAALRQVPGVTGAHVDLASGTATVDGSADPDALRAAVAGEGYEAA